MFPGFTWFKKKSADSIFKLELKVLAQIVKLGTLFITVIAATYVLWKLPIHEIKAAITYYYSESLVIEGKEDKMVNFTSDSGVDIILPAINVVSNPLIMFSKQQLNWALAKGLFIGYISFKVFCIALFLWFYFARKYRERKDL